MSLATASPDLSSEPPAPRRPGKAPRRWRRTAGAALLGVALAAALHLPAYLVVRSEHLLLCTAWTRHRSYREGPSEPWGWRDVQVSAHRDLHARSSVVSGALDLAFVPERTAEIWFRERFESCCSFDDEERCDDRPPSWWKWPPHHSGDGD